MLSGTPRRESGHEGNWTEGLTVEISAADCLEFRSSTASIRGCYSDIPPPRWAKFDVFLETHT
jgi:hypothetical protein